MGKARGKMVNYKQFHAAKKIRRLILGRLCETCQERPADVGHHTSGKDKSGVLEIMLRCTYCEVTCHQQDKNGNPPWSVKIHQRNNDIIRSYYQTPS